VIFITGKVIDHGDEGINFEKTLFIISDKHERYVIIINDLDRSGTFIQGEGNVKGTEKKIILLW